jgi:prepilin-type N-terminal cleavage/methylation domain-containing protein
MRAGYFYGHMGLRRAFIHGFTLIELSIVLVIIGLIVGGVTAGKDLIAAAKLRAQITQIDGYRVAVMAFKGKYGGYPGDLQDSKASALGFAARDATMDIGNSNDQLEDCNYPNVGMHLGCEPALFWNDLGASNLIAQQFPLDLAPAASSGYINTPATIANADLLNYFPRGKMDRTYIAVFYDSIFKPAKNFFYMGPMLQVFNSSIFTHTPATATVNDVVGITPTSALSIDTKIDDGKPLTGKVMGAASYEFNSLDLGTQYWVFDTGVAAGRCLTGPATYSDDVKTNYSYNITTTIFADKPHCRMIFEMF